MTIWYIVIGAAIILIVALIVFLWMAVQDAKQEWKDNQRD